MTEEKQSKANRRDFGSASAVSGSYFGAATSVDLDSFIEGCTDSDRPSCTTVEGLSVSVCQVSYPGLHFNNTFLPIRNFAT